MPTDSKDINKRFDAMDDRFDAMDTQFLKLNNAISKAVTDINTKLKIRAIA